jgi:hypothetical protein
VDAVITLFGGWSVTAGAGAQNESHARPASVGSASHGPGYWRISSPSLRWTCADHTTKDVAACLNLRLFCMTPTGAVRLVRE